MRDAATPEDDGHDAPHPTALTPKQRAANIRAAAAEVLARVEEWRHSPTWRGDDVDQRRYHLTVDAVAALDTLPDPDAHDAVATLIDAVRPLLTEWRPSRPGPEQAIYAAVKRLQSAAAK